MSMRNCILPLFPLPSVNLNLNVWGLGFSSMVGKLMAVLFLNGDVILMDSILDEFYDRFLFLESGYSCLSILGCHRSYGPECVSA